jgi:hypothetical protein
LYIRESLMSSTMTPYGIEVETASNGEKQDRILSTTRSGVVRRA